MIQAHGIEVCSAVALRTWHTGKPEPQDGPQHTAPMDQLCPKGCRNTEEELEAPAVGMRLRRVWGIGKGLAGIDMDFSLASA